MSDFAIKQGDTYPPLEAQLMDGDGDPINLRTVSVSLCIGNDPPVTVDVVDADEGRVQYSWTPGDTDHYAGVMTIEPTGIQ